MPLFPPEVHAADSVIVLSAGSGAVEAVVEVDVFDAAEPDAFA